MTELALHCCAQAFFNCDEQDLVSSDERTSQANGFSCCSTWTLRASRLQLLWLVVSVVALRHVESSWIRDQTHVLCNGRWILNHWTTRKSQIFSFLLWYIPLFCCNCSVTKLYSTLCDSWTTACQVPSPLVCQVHVQWISDVIQPTHPLPPSSAFSLSQHQGLFQWVNSLHQLAKVLELQLQHQSFQWIFRADFL